MMTHFLVSLFRSTTVIYTWDKITQFILLFNYTFTRNFTTTSCSIMLFTHLIIAKKLNSVWMRCFSRLMKYAVVFHSIDFIIFT